MDSFTTWVLQGLSQKQAKTRLSQISDLIDWMPIRQRLDELYHNKSEEGGRPNCDVILMFKILILQQWFGLNDLEVERQMADRISFMSFLGFPNPSPDSRTIWLFKERMAETGIDKVVWAERSWPSNRLEFCNMEKSRVPANSRHDRLSQLASQDY
mgnify:FL=1